LIVYVVILIFINLLTYGQVFKERSLPTTTKDTFFYYLENLQTINIEYFNLDTNKIKEICVIKPEEEKNIYGNKAYPVVIHFKNRYYKNLKLGQILKTDIFYLKSVRFFVDNLATSKDSALNIYMSDLSKIDFIKQDSAIIEIHLSKIEKNKEKTLR